MRHDCICIAYKAVLKLSNCKKVRRAGDLKSMLSKTILLGVSIFRCGSERSVHGRLSWELAPYDRESERTKDFPAWCRNAAAECCFNERAGECGVVWLPTPFLFLDKSKSIPIRIGEQTAWEAVRTDFIENKEKIPSKDYELHGIINNNEYLKSAWDVCLQFPQILLP